MFGVPDVAEVREVAARFGLHLTAEEGEIYRRHLVRSLAAIDQFVQSTFEGEPAPPRFPGAREPGYRPGPAEDPHNAWLWKCRIEGASAGPLRGRTVSFKDHIAVAGMPLTFGSFALEGNVSDVDATVVSRTLEHGGTVVGKNTMTGFVGGFGLGGNTGDYGRPLNPRDHRRVPGGSSSGSAVAVAAGEVDIAFGGDQGGSVRLPSAWTGVVGLKPTFGLVSHFGAGFGTDLSLDYIGPLARSVGDVAAALEAVAGIDGLDPRQPRDCPDRIDVTSTLDSGVAGLRVGILEEGFAGADGAMTEVVEAVASVLSRLGASTERISVPAHLAGSTLHAAIDDEGARASFLAGIFGFGARTHYPEAVLAAVNRMWQHEADLLRPRNKLRLLVGEYSRRHFGGRAYAKAQNLRPVFTRAYDDALAGVDILMMPTTIVTAPEVHDVAVLDSVEARLREVESDINVLASGVARNTRVFNYTGHPALVMPCGLIDGMPASVQFVGRAYSEATLLRVGHAYERETRWVEEMPLPR